MSELDPRWDWIEVTEFGQRDPVYIKGQCNHLETVPVTNALDDRVVAALCVTCDAQLPAEFVPEWYAS